MELHPVKTHCVNYPDKYQVDVNRMLLAHRPSRFKRSGAAALLLCALTVSQLTGCEKAEQTTSRKMNMAPLFEGKPQVADEEVITDITGLSFKNQKAETIQLGGYIGMFSPLTEESALAIIEEELQNHGLDSKASKKTVNAAGQKWSFDLDIKGASEPIYAEFIAAEHVETKSERAQRKKLKLSDDSKNAAEKLRENLSEVHDESTGVIFYTNGFDEQQNLREQVKEFAEWLKTTGLI